MGAAPGSEQAASPNPAYSSQPSARLDAMDRGAHLNHPQRITQHMQNHQPGPDQGQREKAVFRTVPIPVSAFDHIKDTQRAIQARTGRAVTFNEVFATIVREHKQHTQNTNHGEHAHAQQHTPRVSVLLR